MILNDHRRLFDEATQAAVLEYLLLDPPRLRTCNLVVTDFGGAGHRAIFELMKRLDAENALDGPSLLRELSDEHSAALIRLDGASTTERAFERDCRKLRDLTIVRRQAALAAEIHSCIESGNLPKDSHEHLRRARLALSTEAPGFRQGWSRSASPPGVH